MLTLDEWPTASILDAHGDVDAQPFPNLAALAHRTTWYRNATTVGVDLACRPVDPHRPVPEERGGPGRVVSKWFQARGRSELRPIALVG